MATRRSRATQTQETTRTRTADPRAGRAWTRQWIPAPREDPGFSEGDLEMGILALARAGYLELMERLIEVDEQLFPEHRGIVRAHAQALLGPHRRQNMAVLERVSREVDRSADARSHARECLAFLREEWPRLKR